MTKRWKRIIGLLAVTVVILGIQANQVQANDDVNNDNYHEFTYQYYYFIEDGNRIFDGIDFNNIINESIEATIVPRESYGSFYNFLEVPGGVEHDPYGYWHYSAPNGQRTSVLEKAYQLEINLGDVGATVAVGDELNRQVIATEANSSVFIDLYTSIYVESHNTSDSIDRNWRVYLTCRYEFEGMLLGENTSMVNASLADLLATSPPLRLNLSVVEGSPIGMWINPSDEELEEPEELEVTQSFGIWNGNGDAMAIIDEELEEFVSLGFANGDLLTDVQYTVTSGSTIITLKEEFLSTLANGEYTFTARFTNDRSIDLKIAISNVASGDDAGNPDIVTDNKENKLNTENESNAKGKTNRAPQTGDTANVVLLYGLLGVAVIVATGAIYYKKYRKGTN